MSCVMVNSHGLLSRLFVMADNAFDAVGRVAIAYCRVYGWSNTCFSWSGSCNYLHDAGSLGRESGDARCIDR